MRTYVSPKTGWQFGVLGFESLRSFHCFQLKSSKFHFGRLKVGSNFSAGSQEHKSQTYFISLLVNPCEPLRKRAVWREPEGGTRKNTYVTAR